MDKLIREKIKDLKAKIVQTRTLDEDLKICQSVMPEDTYYWLDYEVNVSWAVKSIDEVKEVLKKFAKKGIMLDYFQESDTNPKWKLKGKKAGIRLSPDWSRDEETQGATCRLVKVGEKTETYPIYKLMCDPSVDTATV